MQSDINKSAKTRKLNTTELSTKRDVKMAEYNVPTHNSFNSLPNEEETDLTMDEDNNQQEINKKLPPPIVLHGQSSSHVGLTKLIKEQFTSNFHIKYTKYSVNITINDRADRRKLMEHLKSQEVEFHTYTDSEEKTHAFVIRGLTSDTEPAEIEEQIKNEHRIPVKKCYKMEFKKYPQQNTTQALFLLITTNKVTLKDISQKVKYVMYTRIYFERRRNNKRITQCHNCQSWGHATTNCYAATKCMFCAENHTTKSCEKKEGKPKCTNCQANHKANDITCPVYTQRLKWMETNAAQKQKTRNTNYQHKEQDFPPTLNPAPPPQENTWTQRDALQQSSNQQQQQSHQQEQHYQGNQQQSSQGQHHQPPTYTGKPPSPTQHPPETINIFKELTEQFNILHTLVNMQGILKAVTELNTLLKTCTTPEQKFITYSEFIKNIRIYDI